jgi:peptide deformylase
MDCHGMDGRSGQEQAEKMEGFKARLCQHEEAHLHGHLVVDDSALSSPYLTQ